MLTKPRWTTGLLLGCTSLHKPSKRSEDSCASWRKVTPAESRAVSQRGLRLRAIKWKAARLLQLFKMTLRWWDSEQLKGVSLLRGDMQREGVSYIRDNFPQVLRFLLNVPLFSFLLLSTVINNNNFSYLASWSFLSRVWDRAQEQQQVRPASYFKPDLSTKL